MTDIKNLFEHLSDELAQVPFDLLLQSGDVRLERIISNSHSSPEHF